MGMGKYYIKQLLIIWLKPIGDIWLKQFGLPSLLSKKGLGFQSMQGKNSWPFHLHLTQFVFASRWLEVNGFEWSFQKPRLGKGANCTTQSVGPHMKEMGKFPSKLQFRQHTTVEIFKSIVHKFADCPTVCFPPTLLFMQFWQKQLRGVAQ